MEKAGQKLKSKDEDPNKVIRKEKILKIEVDSSDNEDAEPEVTLNSTEKKLQVEIETK